MRTAPDNHQKRLYLVIVRFAETKKFRDAGTFRSEREAKAFGALYGDPFYEVTMSRYVRSGWPWSQRTKRVTNAARNK